MLQWLPIDTFQGTKHHILRQTENWRGVSKKTSGMVGCDSAQSGDSLYAIPLNDEIPHFQATGTLDIQVNVGEGRFVQMQKSFED